MAEKVIASGADIVPVSVTIASGQSLSDAVVLDRGKPGGVTLPSSIDGATVLTFQLSYDNGVSFANMYAFGSEYSLTVAISQSVPMAFADFFAATHMKVRLGTASSAVTATDNRTLKFALVP